jgi:hypothetical protein
MTDHLGFSAALHLALDRADRAKVRSFRDNLGRLIPVIDFDALTIYGNGDDDLAAVLRHLADRVDAALAADDQAVA